MDKKNEYLLKINFPNPAPSDWNALSDDEKLRQITAKKARRARAKENHRESLREIVMEAKMTEQPGKNQIVFSYYLDGGMEELEKLAEGGNLDAQIDLAACRVEKEIDAEKNLRFLKEKAGEGNTLALNDLGFIYSGVDDEKSEEYFKKSAALGNAQAMFTLGNHAWILRESLPKEKLSQAKGYLEAALKKDADSQTAKMAKDWLKDIQNALGE